MRRGPAYAQHIDVSRDGDLSFRPPLELTDDLCGYKYVYWIDNFDGTYTLSPYNDEVSPIIEDLACITT